MMREACGLGEGVRRGLQTEGACAAEGAEGGGYARQAGEVGGCVKV